MDVISIDNGRSTWLFPTEEFVPLGGADGIAIIEQVAQRYQFKDFPQQPKREDIDKNGLRFGMGVFELDGKKSVINEFAMYNDGLVAVSNTTEQSNAFLESVVEFVIASFEFRRPISPIKKVFVSTATVEFASDVGNLLSKQSKLLGLIGEYLNASQGTSLDPVVTRLDVTLDDLQTAANKPRLIIEARTTIPLSRRRFYCNAAMHTHALLELLGKLEADFMNP